MRAPLVLVLLAASTACGKEKRPENVAATDAVGGAREPCRGSDPPPPKTVLEGWPHQKVGELPRDGGRFDTEGVVVFAFEPRPCPEGAMCKPQMSSHVQLAETKDAAAARVVLFTPNPRSIPDGVPLRASVFLCPRGAGDIEGELIAWTR